MTCPHCGGRNVFRDEQTGEAYCLHCGWRENPAHPDDGNARPPARWPRKRRKR